VRSGFRRFAIRAGLALLGAALFCGYAMAPSLVFLPYVALVPWAVLYMGPRRPGVSPLYFLFAGYLCFVLCYRPMFSVYWWVPPAAALFFVPAWLLFPVLVRPIQRLDLPRSITLPVVWVGFEWARLLLATGHLDLFALGYSQARLAPLVQIADVTGVYGISFLVAAVNGLLADATFALKDAAWRPRILLREPRIVIPATVIATAFAAVIGYGFLRLEIARDTPGPRMALDRGDLSVPPGSADLIVRPGNAILDDVERLASRNGSMVLLGAQGRAEGPIGRSTSSVFLVDAAGTVHGRYDKEILCPFSEYVPLDRAVGVVAPQIQRAYRRLVREAWGSPKTLARGTHMTMFELPWKDGTLRFAAVIGVESAYPPLVAEASRRGARFVVNLTSDGYVGGVMQEQLLRVCMLRAIENRIAFVRAGVAGISGFIDPQGRLRGVPADIVPLSPAGTTAYAASHDAFTLLCVAVSLWLLARSLLRGDPTMTPIPVPAGATI
jgi:apolipoprotein N-acyltransferase